MQIPKVVREKPDVAYIIVRNLHSAAIGDGESVRWVITGDTPPTGYTWIPGKDVILNDASGTTTCAGIMKLGGVITTLPVGDYGWCQVFGYHPNVKTDAAALAAGTVVQGDAAGEVIAAVVGAAGDITKRRIGVCLKTGSGNRAGIMLRAM